jgi:hypothetical protein
LAQGKTIGNAMLKERLVNILAEASVVILAGLCGAMFPDGPARWIVPLAILIVAVSIIVWINIRRYRRDR